MILHGMLSAKQLSYSSLFPLSAKSPVLHAVYLNLFVGFGFGSIGDSLKKGVSKMSKMGALLTGEDAAAPAQHPPPPAEAKLPAGWEVLNDDRGVVFYGHPESKITQCVSSNICLEFLNQTWLVLQV
jgi:hypothetical protein